MPKMNFGSKIILTATEECVSVRDNLDLLFRVHCLRFNLLGVEECVYYVYEIIGTHCLEFIFEIHSLGSRVEVHCTDKYPSPLVHCSS